MLASPNLLSFLITNGKKPSYKVHSILHKMLHKGFIYLFIVMI